ncbi:catabolite control protein A [Bacillus safensis]|uniref:Catabolite control protein A n=2 Tax=Bacillus safensis TaxID=561879 RepID=A0A5S9M1W1_BACIA|nr:catabolite control protein A [Bacillus safensis]
MSVSIKDVALKAGVSIASVSRVLSGKPGVGAQTAERIKQVIDELGYRPNLGARGLVKKRKTGNIAVVVPRGSYILNNPFFSTILDGIAKELDETEFNMLMSFTSVQQQRLLETQAVDGAILFSPRNEELSMDWLKSLAIPIIVVGSYLEDSPFPCVRPDDEEGVCQSVTALFDKGHRTIGLVNGPMSSMHSVRYYKGYERTLKRLGLTMNKELVFELDEFDGGGKVVEVVSQFLQGNQHMTGVVCSSDFLAIGVMKAAENANVSIPHDLSVVGADDVPIASFLTPSLSSVHVDLVGMGRKAVSLLTQLLEGEQLEAMEHISPMYYIDRGTTGTPKKM